MNKKWKVVILSLIIMVSSFVPSYSYDLKHTPPIVKESQAYACMKDRNASKEFLNNIHFIYEYSQEIGIDPSIIVAISAIETGYGKSHLFVSYHNPGGIKAKGGWRRFKNTKEGYKGMINLMATYAGILNKRSWLFGKAVTTQQLGNYYWVEQGVDAGYHRQLTRMIKIMQSYPIKESRKMINETKKQNKIVKKTKKENKKSPLDIIYNIINGDSSEFNAYDYIMNFTK